MSGAITAGPRAGPSAGGAGSRGGGSLPWTSTPCSQPWGLSWALGPGPQPPTQRPAEDAPTPITSHLRAHSSTSCRDTPEPKIKGEVWLSLWAVPSPKPTLFSPRGFSSETEGSPMPSSAFLPSHGHARVRCPHHLPRVPRPQLSASTLCSPAHPPRRQWGLAPQTTGHELLTPS